MSCSSVATTLGLHLKILNLCPRVEMYTSYADSATVEPSIPTSAAPNTPAMSHKTNVNVDSMTPLPPRMGPPPTSSPAMPEQHSPQTGVPTAVAAGQPTGTWPIDGMNDLHLSGSEPRIYPGMISRRHRTNSLRQSSAHESDERAAAARQIITDAVEEGHEGVDAETME